MRTLVVASSARSSSPSSAWLWLPWRRQLWWYLAVLIADASSAAIGIFFSVTSPSSSSPTICCGWDVVGLAFFRILSILGTIGYSYVYRRPSTPPSQRQRQQTDDRGGKSDDEELESLLLLEEPLLSKLRRLIARLPFLCEASAFASVSVVAVRCLSRLDVEIGLYANRRPQHPLYWSSLALNAALPVIEAWNLQSVEQVAYEWGSEKRIYRQRQDEGLVQPLLSNGGSDADSDGVDGDEEQQQQQRPQPDRRKQQSSSSSSSSSSYTAKWSDLIDVCAPDKLLIGTATLFLFAAAVANVYVPKFTGQVLDELVNANNRNVTAATFSTMPMFLQVGDGGSRPDGNSIVHIPGFLRNIQLLLAVSILGGIFEGIRGMIFTMVAARVNVRLRIKLMDTLLSQEIGFYDTTRTGDVTSRLSSDTSIVGASVTNNVNMFLRSIIRATGVFIFMLAISWQLTIISFVTVPTVSVLSKWYGRYIRKLTKLQQKKLADGNSVSESSLSCMSTVRAFGAETVELAEFEGSMKEYLTLNKHAAGKVFDTAQLFCLCLALRYPKSDMHATRYYLTRYFRTFVGLFALGRSRNIRVLHMRWRVTRGSKSSRSILRWAARPERRYDRWAAG